MTLSRCLGKPPRVAEGVALASIPAIDGCGTQLLIGRGVQPPMSKVFWIIVSDSGLMAISGGRKNRMKYEMQAGLHRAAAKSSTVGY